MCWFSMARVFMYVFNLALFFAGAATLGVGIWIMESASTVQLGDLNFSQNGAIVLIVAGSIACIMGFLGCCGAKKENSGILGLYFALLLVLVIMQVAVGIWAAVNFDSIEGAVDATLKDLDLEYNTTNDAVTLNEISLQLSCCGINSTADYSCKLFTDDITPNCECKDSGCTPCGSTKIYTQSCDVAVTAFIDENMRIIAGIGIAIGLAEILGLIFSCCMCQSIKEKNGYA